MSDEARKLAWLKARHDYVTGSDMAVVMRIGWSGKTRDELLHEKIHRVIDFKDSNAMWWGRYLERANFDAFCMAMGLLGLYPEPWTLNVSAGSYVASTVDGKVYGTGVSPPFHPVVEFPGNESPAMPSRTVPFAVEMKNTDKKHLKINEAHEIQLRVNMMVHDLDTGYLVSKQGASTMRAWVVERDLDTEWEMLKAAKAFMEEVIHERGLLGLP